MRLPLLLLLGLSSACFAKDATIQSPNGNITITISDQQATPSYKISFNGKDVIENSALGFEFKQQAAFAEGFTITDVNNSQHNSQWQQPWGERQTIIDKHNELAVTFKKPAPQGGTYTVRFRAFNDGVGFRYEVPKQAGFENIEITKELTEFAISGADKATAWWIPARGWNRYEYVYNTTPLQQAALAHTPFTFKNADGVHVSIHEAALVDYAGMVLNQRRPGTLQADLTPWSDGVAVKKHGAFNTPWRTIQIGDKAVDLINSDIILNLNEPNKLGDVSWVKPGKYVGIWWGMHINENTWGSGEKHGATTKETKRYMDFAAKYGFDGVLVEGWNIGWDGDWFFNGDVFSFTKPYPDFDIAELTRYGKEKGVQLIGHHETSGNVTNYRNQMEDAYALYEKSNVSQVKTGYVADGGNIKRIDENGIARHEWHDGQFMVNEYLHSVQLAAKHKISINTHEPIKDTGLRRTYPNWIAREGARGQEFNAWGTPPNPPEHIPMLAFTRMLAGPMDFTPGIFDMSFNGLGGDTNRPQTTLAKQLALYVVMYSPIQMAADLPRNYLAKPDAFKFIQDVPTDWQQSIALAGEVGDYVVFARKERKRDNYSGNDWFLGAVTDEQARSIEIKLDFLEQGKKFEAQIYRDGNNAQWKNNPYDLKIEKRIVTAADKLTLKLATSGGTAIRFKAL
ncbi:glycoside hydrolase family 97 protein [Pseudoalteromonas sp. SR44-5]|uniref:glycoside hydrolase family 97 protein n=1 Tax=unclassified Pseudoalteromonas TaxID=194690 RepID=UPI0016039A58|nr:MULTISPECIES: glycoside hydrolase family 97 protein [unclassified Pseudoalteromonas]MBB1343159.1 glycoside hydrolase family 97 protein [Pseudoalteromonas sp. SR45-6]MBB1368136.1 glycoside hydrolase family 97 protein [Pseudoalteromonas sp. SR44-5]MBB1435914.1 glycoside hydrolase family 97 protein [Pseudoalteromonas sp. SG43-6]MBB1480861.1 glycoside hydrolase family 97 protein [Pseudoalteromonas sp. SG41-2]